MQIDKLCVAVTYLTSYSAVLSLGVASIAHTLWDNHSFQRCTSLKHAKR